MTIFRWLVIENEKKGAAAARYTPKSDVLLLPAYLRERQNDAGSLSRATKCTDAICLFASGQKPVAAFAAAALGGWCKLQRESTSYSSFP